jgi:hypothetical protein
LLWSLDMPNIRKSKQRKPNRRPRYRRKKIEFELWDGTTVVQKIPAIFSLGIRIVRSKGG